MIREAGDEVACATRVSCCTRESRWKMPARSSAAVSAYLMQTLLGIHCRVLSNVTNRFFGTYVGLYDRFPVPTMILEDERVCRSHNNMNAVVFCERIAIAHLIGSPKGKVKLDLVPFNDDAVFPTGVDPVGKQGPTVYAGACD